MNANAAKYRPNGVSGFVGATLNIIFVIYALCCIVPLLLMVAVSFTDQKTIVEFGYRFIPDKISFEAYYFLLKEPELVVRAYLVTIVVTVAGSLLNVMTSAMYAYAISRKSFPFRKFFTLLILVTMLFYGGIPTLYYVYVKILLLKDTLWALILPGLGQGFYIFIMMTYFKQNVPGEIIEAAKIDGATEYRAFFHIVLSLSMPILATIGLFSALFYWNDFFNCLIFIDNEKLYNLQYTMQRAILNLNYLTKMLSMASPTAARNVGNSIRDLPSESVRMAMVIVAVGPIVLAYPFFQRFFIEGLVLGSIKG